MILRHGIWLRGFEEIFAEAAVLVRTDGGMQLWRRTYDAERVSQIAIEIVRRGDCPS